MKKLFLLIVLCACCALSLKAQEEDVLRPKGKPAGSTAAQPESLRSASQMTITYGVEAGLNYNMFSRDIEGILPDSRFAVYKKGAGIAPIFGVVADYSFNESFGVQLRAAYDDKSFSNKQSGKRDCLANVTDENGVVINQFVTEADINSEYEVNVVYTSFTGLLRFNPTPRLSITAGPTLQILSGDATQTDKEEILSTGECYYNFGTPQQSKTLESTATVGDITKNRIGIDLGIGYSFPFSQSISLVPRIGYQFMLSTITPDENGFDDSRDLTMGNVPFTAKNAKLNSLQLAVALMFNL